MALLKDLAVVLRRLDYSETSQVLVIFTREHGQQRVIAKGVKRSTKKKASTGIDLLELGSIVFSQRAGNEGVLATLTEWRQVETFSHLWQGSTTGESGREGAAGDSRSALARLYSAQYAAEVTAQLTEVGDPHPALFDALTALLRDLAIGEPGIELVRYLWTMLREIGLVPELTTCMRCGSSVSGDRVLYFSSRAGGAICRDCEPQMVEKHRIDPAAAKWLSSALHGHVVDDAHPAQEDRDERHGQSKVARVGADARLVRQAFDLLDYHLTETMGKPARLKSMLIDVLRSSP